MSSRSTVEERTTEWNICVLDLIHLFLPFCLSKNHICISSIPQQLPPISPSISLCSTPFSLSFLSPPFSPSTFTPRDPFFLSLLYSIVPSLPGFSFLFLCSLLLTLFFYFSLPRVIFLLQPPPQSLSLFLSFLIQKGTTLVETEMVIIFVRVSF